MKKILSVSLALSIVCSACSSFQKATQNKSEAERGLASQALSDERPLDPVSEAEDLRDAKSPALNGAIHSRVPAERARAAQAIGRILKPELIDSLLGLLSDPDVSVVKNALFSAGQMAWNPTAAGGLEKELTQACAKSLSSYDGPIRQRALEAIGKLALAQAPALILPSLQDPDDSVRAEAVLSLYRALSVESNRALDVVPLGDNVISALARLENDSSSSVTQNVAFVLGHSKNPKAAHEILKLAAAHDLWTRYFAVSSMGSFELTALGSMQANAVFAKAAQDHDYSLRVEAIAQAQKLKVLDQFSKKRLQALSRDQFFHVRMTLASALGGLKDSDDLLGALVTDSSPNVRSAALTSMIQLHPDSARALVSTAQQDPAWQYRAAAASALTQDLFDLAPKFLADSELHVRAAALTSLGSLIDTSSYALLKSTSASDVVYDRESAIGALGSRKESTVSADLWSAYLNSSGPKWIGSRVGVVEAFSALSGAEVDGDLQKVLAQDPEQVVRDEASLALLAHKVVAKESAVPPGRSPFRNLHFKSNPYLLIETTRGKMMAELFAQDAPIHVATVFGLAKSGFYDGQMWHRVVSDFVAQGGSPEEVGLPALSFALRAEINPVHFKRGSLGMPRASSWETGDAELFIDHVPTPSLDGQYTVYGQIISGLEVLDQIEVGDRIIRVRPIE